MKKILTFFTIAFVLALTFTTWGFAVDTHVARAEESISYICIEPADLKGNDYAGATNVPVIGEDGSVLFYLIESYFYPISAQVFGGRTYNCVRIDGVEANAYIDTTEASKSLPEGATVENALPGNLLLKDGVTVTLDGETVDTRKGWTVKLIGVKENDFYIQASKDSTVVCGLAPKDNFTVSNITYHPVALAKRDGMLTSTPDGTVEKNDGADKSTILRVVLIIGIAIPAIIIAIMIFKPGRNSAKTNYDRHAMHTRREEEIDYDRDRRYDREKDYSRRAPYDDRRYDDRDYDDRQQGYAPRDGYRDEYNRDYDSYRDNRDRPHDDRDYDRRR